MPVSTYLKAGSFVVAAATALFAAAGTVAIPSFWAYLAILAAVMTVSFAVLDPDLWLPRTQIRVYRWCSPPSIGCAIMSPNRSIGRVQGASLGRGRSNANAVDGAARAAAAR